MNAATILREFLRQPILRIDARAGGSVTVAAAPGSLIVSRHISGDRCKFAFSRVLELPVVPAFVSTPDKLVMMKQLSAALDPTVMSESQSGVRLVRHRDVDVQQLIAAPFGGGAADPDVIRPVNTRSFNVADITVCRATDGAGTGATLGRACATREMDVVNAIVDEHDERALQDVFRSFEDTSRRRVQQSRDNDQRNAESPPSTEASGETCTSRLELRAVDGDIDGEIFQPPSLYVDGIVPIESPEPPVAPPIVRIPKSTYYSNLDAGDTLDEENDNEALVTSTVTNERMDDNDDDDELATQDQAAAMYLASRSGVP